MSLESSEKQTGRSVPLTASQQAAVAKNAATAEKVRNVVAKSTGGTAKPSKSAGANDVDAKRSEPAAPETSKPNAAVVAEPPEPVEDKAAAKARAKQEKAEAKARAKAEKAELKKAAKAERSRVASGGGIKDLIVLHVEKIVLGICVLAAIGIIYAGVGTLSLAPNHHPADMGRKLDGIDARIKNPSFQSKEAEFTIPTYDANVGRFKSSIRPTSLVLSIPWNPILVPPQKRGNPDLYAPVHLLATAGDGVFLVTQLKPQQKNKENAARDAAPPRAGAAPGGAVVAPGAAGGAAPAAAGDAALLIGGGEQAPGPAAPAAIPDGKWLPIPNDVLPNAGVAAPAGDSEQRVFPESRRWISVVGLLPIKQQQSAYDKEFATAFDHDPHRDQPTYAEVRFQRLEIPPGTAESQLDWSKAKEWSWKDQLSINKAEQRVWVLTASEIVPLKYIRNDAARMPENLRNTGLGVISKPLGPLVNQSWEPWARHPRLFEAPIIEEPVEEAQPEEEDAPAANAPPAAPQQNPNDPFDFNKPVVAPAPKKKATKKAVRKPRAHQESSQVENQLVRVFDFTVQPGKQYRYKLQLMLRNPNFQIPAKNLQDPKLATNGWLMTAWSTASNTVAVPDGQSVMADTVVHPDPPPPIAAGGPRLNAAQLAAQAAAETAETTARVVVKILNFDSAQETFAILKLRRGALAAGTARQIILNSLRHEVAKKDGANIHTDLVLADFRGGEKIAEGLEAPAEMLFIDAAGQLVVQNSVQDETWVRAVHELLKLFDAAAPAADPMAKAAEAADPKNDIKALQDNAKGPKPPRRNK